VRRLAFVLALMTVFLAGCQRTPDTFAVDERLAELPRFDPHPFTAEHVTDGVLTLHTSVQPRVNEKAADSDYTDIARIVWNTYRPKFDALVISAEGAPTERRFTHADLQMMFGEPARTMKPEDYPSDLRVAFLLGSDVALFVGFVIVCVGIIRYDVVRRRRQD
jgi:hypothetical protein